MDMNTSLRKTVLALLCGLMCAGVSAQFMEAKEFAAELDQVEFGNAPTSGGTIFVKRCDQCTSLAVTFRAQTRFFDGDRPITAAKAEQIVDRGATVLFDPDSRDVVRVIFWPAS